LQDAAAAGSLDHRSVIEAPDAQDWPVRRTSFREWDSRQGSGAVEVNRWREQVTGQHQRLLCLKPLDHKVAGGGVDDPDEFGHSLHVPLD